MFQMNWKNRSGAAFYTNNLNTMGAVMNRPVSPRNVRRLGFEKVGVGGHGTVIYLTAHK